MVKPPRIVLVDMLRVVPRALGRYTGTLLAVFVAQTLVAMACMVAIAIVLAQAFAHLPLWDEAVDGDLVALAWCIRGAPAAIVACGGLVVAALLLWLLVSWFVVGGLLGVLAQEPDGRAETARCFGASGAATYLKFARLAVCSVPSWLLALFAFFACSSAMAPRFATALTVSDLIVPVAVSILPALIVLHVAWTVSDYARVELAVRHDSHDPSVAGAYLRALAFVIRRPITLVHGALGWLVFALVTLAYGYLAHGHPMYGAEGAVTLFVIRQGVALARVAVQVGVLAGQVELGHTGVLPPHRDSKPTAKS
jgi:hypothetical protein